MFLVYILFLVCAVSAKKSTEWTEVSPLPEVLSDHSCTTVDAEIFTFGGCHEQVCADVGTVNFTCFCTDVSKHTNIYDIKTDKWTRGADMPRPRYRHTSEEVDGKVYVISGLDVDDNVVTQVDVYDIASDSWTVPADLEVPAEHAGSDCGAFVIGTDIYLGGGYSADYIALASTHKLDTLTLTWAFGVADLVHARGDVCGVHTFKKGETGFLIGGYSSSDWCTPLFDIESFAGSSWKEGHKKAAHSDDPRTDADSACVLVGRNIYQLGGEQKSDACETVVIDHAEVYNIDQDLWFARDEMTLPDARFRSCASSFKNQIYLIGGQGTFASGAYPVLDSVLTFDTSSAWLASSPCLLMCLFLALFLSV